ncbi:carotenoid oxygenase family protein [Aquabacterium sp. J223]|uniref:carotenoid oxygenase family protein n=1 Tax=Aquabacterium sp. J223 TaxID=2898431 RepID=UPI0021ADAC70|nr:carotenoid oxygenase family protein [Aquabacterium sp. J223]UUX96406.1 carotenoid oxygenase family protein [Aquabacterium sp. J223]
MRFPDSPVFTGYQAPSRVESDIGDLEVLGTLPPELRGTFYRVGPDPQFPPKQGNDIFFNGDGLVHMLRFADDGRVDYRSRYVRTDKFVAERRAGRALFGAYRNPYTDDDSVKGMVRGTANTGVCLHADKLWALKEDSPPVLMDPESLQTLGYHTFDGALKSKTFTAHPHFDSETGEMFAIGFAAKGEATPDIAYYVIDKDGRITHEAWIKAPYSGMVHDFAVTKDYVVFPIVPITSNEAWLRQGRPHYHWDPRVPVYMGVMPRYGRAEDLRWFKGHNRYSTHIFNGWNEGRRIFVDTAVAKGNPFPFFPDITGAPFDLGASAPHVSRWIIDLDRTDDGFDEECYDHEVCEFPRVDDRLQTRRHRYGYISSLDVFKPWTRSVATERPMMMFNSMSRFDFEEKKHERWFIGEASTLEEVQFVPRSRDAPEGDGFLIALLLRHGQPHTDLAVLDAMNVTAGPLALVRIPVRLRPGLHGTWVPHWKRPANPLRR